MRSRFRANGAIASTWETSVAGWRGYVGTMPVPITIRFVHAAIVPSNVSGSKPIGTAGSQTASIPARSAAITALTVEAASGWNTATLSEISLTSPPPRGTSIPGLTESDSLVDRNESHELACEFSHPSLVALESLAPTRTGAPRGANWYDLEAARRLHAQRRENTCRTVIGAGRIGEFPTERAGRRFGGARAQRWVH